MATRYQGTFVISWSQAELDGLTGANPATLCAGSAWRWSGRAARVDDSRDIFILHNCDGIADIRPRAAQQVRRLLGNPGVLFQSGADDDPDQRLFRAGFEVTDGCKSYQATLIDFENDRPPMVLFVGEMPPADQDLWVVSCTTGGKVVRPESETKGTICFIPGTWITTPDGAKLVEDLCEGDKVCTKDNGHQVIRWIGSRDVTGGRLVAMPHLRPVRLSAHVLGDGEPDRDLVVSPDHRVLIKGRAAQALFNTTEVLVSISDLINDRTIRVDHRYRSVSYIHLMMDQHQILWANGVEVESFHPAGMNPDHMGTDQRSGLLERFPDVGEDVYSYGDYVRKSLTRSEAAILSYDGLGGH